MANSDQKGVVHPADDVDCWLEHDSSVMLKAVTRFGDPVELTADDARAVAAALIGFAEQLEPLGQSSDVPKPPALAGRKTEERPSDLGTLELQVGDGVVFAIFCPRARGRTTAATSGGFTPAA